MSKATTPIKLEKLNEIVSTMRAVGDDMEKTSGNAGGTTWCRADRVGMAKVAGWLRKTAKSLETLRPLLEAATPAGDASQEDDARKVVSLRVLPPEDGALADEGQAGAEAPAPEAGEPSAEERPDGEGA